VKHQAQANKSRRGLRGIMKIGALTSIATAALAASLPLAAHHSFTAEFDGSKQIKATGAVTKLDWQNPHGWIHLTVTELCERTGPPGPPQPDAKEEPWACRAPDSKEGAAD
jgi:hypothetical protein